MAKVVAVVFAGSEGKPRYIPGIGSKSSVHIGQRTSSNNLVSSMELDPTGQYVLVRITDANGVPVRQFDKTSDMFMLRGDYLGIPVDAGTVLFEDEKPEVKKAK